MKSYKLALAAGAAAGLLVLSNGAVNAQSRNGQCSEPGACQMQNQPAQGNGNQQGPGNRHSHADHQGNGQGNGSNRGRGAGPQAGAWEASLPPKVPGDAPAAVIAAMQDGLADEQHAYAVYAAVIEQFGAVRPFTNIQRSEAQHIAAWEYLFDRYDIAVPAAAEFDIPEFASLGDACQAAAEAEIANRGLYDAMLETFVDYPDLTQVATQLRTASDANHLPAFERCAN